MKQDGDRDGAVIELSSIIYKFLFNIFLIFSKYILTFNVSHIFNQTFGKYTYTYTTILKYFEHFNALYHLIFNNIFIGFNKFVFSFTIR